MKRLRLCTEVFLDIGAGAVLGILAIIGVLVFGLVLICLLTIFFIGAVIVCLIGFPVLSLLLGVFLLVGYPISSGRIVKQKIKEFKESLKPRDQVAS